MVKNTDIWRKIHQAETWDNFYPTTDAQAFAKYHITDAHHKSILDLGSGGGANAIFFAKLGMEVHAMDVSKDALLKLQRRARENSVEIVSGIADFRSIPYVSNSFDYVYSGAVLYYGREDDFFKAVREVYRVLKRDGLCRIHTKSAGDYWVRHGMPLGDNAYQITGDHFEAGLEIYCAPLEKIHEAFAGFRKLTVGIEEFNYISLEDRKSFWVITAMK